MVERQLRWYMYSTRIPERHFWNILFINRLDEIEQIRQKLREELNPLVEDTLVSLKPIVSETLIDRGKINGSDLHYEIVCLEGVVSAIDFSRVYQGDVRWDRRLRPRKTVEGWYGLMDTVNRGEI